MIPIHPHLNHRLLLVRRHLDLQHRLACTDSRLAPHPPVHLHPFLHRCATFLFSLLLHLHRDRVPHILLLHHRLVYTDSRLAPHPLVHLHLFLHLCVPLLLPLLLHLHRYRVPHIRFLHRLIKQHHPRPTCLYPSRLRRYHGQMIRLIRLVIRLHRRIKRFSVSPAPFQIIQAGPKTCWKFTNTSLRDRLQQRKCPETGGKNGRTVWRST